MPDYHIANPKLGYYVVNGQKFDNKAEALITATAANTYCEWNFNKDILAKVKWDEEPVESLAELYRQRALQIREQYDHVVLNYSGGGDSKNILDTFLTNNIKLDEIFVTWPEEGARGTYRPGRTDSSAANFMSEWDLTLLPDLKQLANDHPEIKITFYDYTHDLLQEYKQNEEWYKLSAGDHLNPAIIKRLDSNKFDRKLVDKGLRVAHIIGIDKPRMMYQDGKYYVFYLDLVLGPAAPVYNEFYTPQNSIELFYWTPDFPDIVRKQAHVIKQFFQQNPALIQIISGHQSYTSRTAYEMIVRSLLYPTWDNSRFQASKPSKVFTCEYDQWFWEKFSGTRAHDVWKTGLKTVTDQIDDKWFNFDYAGNKSGFVGMISPMYCIG